MKKHLWPLLSCLSLFLDCGVRGQANHPRNAPYEAGFVIHALPLDWFVSIDLVPGCEALKSNNLKAAEELFSAAIRKDPNQPALYVGYLQAIPQKREGLLAPYRADARRAATAVNHFKLGLLATYVRMDWLNLHSDEGFRKSDVIQYEAVEHMEAAYKMVHSPMIGFLLYRTYDQCRRTYTTKVIRGKPVVVKPTHIQVEEDMLERMSRPAIYKTYLHAKSNYWIGEQPGTPQLSGSDLRVLGRLVHAMWAHHGGMLGRPVQKMVDGNIIISYVFTPVSAENQRAMEYMGQWEKRIKEEASRKLASNQ